MANVVGQAYALTVLTPIRPGREAELRSYLDGLPTGADSPLAKVTSTHVARWVIFPQLVYQGRPQKPDALKSQYLLFSSSFDGDLDPYLDLLCARMAPEVDAIWGCCVGYPGLADRGLFKRYIRHNQIDSAFFVAAYPTTTVAQVRAALALKERILAFALEAQGMDDQRLHQTFRERMLSSPANSEA